MLRALSTLASHPLYRTIVVMKAMIFAAGIGSRLKELTRDTPKCLMQVGGVTMLEHVIEKLKQVGVREVAINVHHHAAQVIRFVEERHRFGISVTFSPEEDLLDTGGGLKKARALFEGETAFIVHNSDVYCTADLGALTMQHAKTGAIATLAVMRRDSTRGLFFDHDMRLVGWTEEKAPPPPQARLLAFGGMSVCSSELFQFMDARPKFSLIETFLAAARATNRVYGSTIDADSWVDIGTPERLEDLQRRLQQK